MQPEVDGGVKCEGEMDRWIGCISIKAQLDSIRLHAGFTMSYKVIVIIPCHTDNGKLPVPSQLVAEHT